MTAALDHHRTDDEFDDKKTTFSRETSKPAQHADIMSEEAAADDDFSGLSGFFFYTFFVHPATAWILRPGRFERKKSIMYAIAFLAAIAAVKTGK